MSAARRTCILRPPRFATKHQARVRLTQPGATTARSSMVTPKDVSTSGICLLYRGYVHPGASCEVELITLYGSWLKIGGRVVRCRYVEDGLHEIGIQFESEIDVTLVCPEATERAVVIATQDEFLWELASTWLTQSNANRSRVADVEQLVISLENPVDLLIIDGTFGDPDGTEVARFVRRNGYFGYMVGLHEAGQDALAEAYLDAGADQAIEKPLSRNVTESMLEASRVEPTVSTLASETGARDILERCISMLNASVFDVAEALRVERLDDVLSVTERISSAAGACGFEEINELAKDVTVRCADKSIEQAAAEFSKLARLISAASV